MSVQILRGDQSVYKKRKIKKEKKSINPTNAQMNNYSQFIAQTKGESSSHPLRILYYSNKLKAEILIKGDSNYFQQKFLRSLL